MDLGPKLDAAPISREEAGQALVVAMTMPEAYTELSALLHCSKGAASRPFSKTHTHTLSLAFFETAVAL